MLETVYPTRTWCTFDVERDELTTVQDGYDGISVVTVPGDAARMWVCRAGVDAKPADIH